MSTAAHIRPAITLGSTVLCSDDQRCELRRIVLDPMARRVTHLVVGVPDDRRPGWLVPIGLATPVGDVIRLRCSAEEMLALEAAKPFPVPAFRDGDPGPGAGPPSFYRGASLDQAAIHPGDRVRALDGVIGDAVGVVSDGRDPAQATHLLVAMAPGVGPRRVAVPMRRISSLKDGVQLTLSVSEIRELPVYEAQD